MRTRKALPPLLREDGPFEFISQPDPRHYVAKCKRCGKVIERGASYFYSKTVVSCGCANAARLNIRNKIEEKHISLRSNGYYVDIRRLKKCKGGFKTLDEAVAWRDSVLHPVPAVKYQPRVLPPLMQPEGPFEYVESYKIGKRIRFKARCKICGKIVDWGASAFYSMSTHSCGCMHYKKRSQPKLEIATATPQRTKEKICKKCGKTYMGGRNSKYCPECKEHIQSIYIRDRDRRSRGWSEEEIANNPKSIFVCKRSADDVKPGMRYNHWTVIARAESGPRHRSQFLCRCDCGKERVVPFSSLASGNSKSCGCIKKKPQRNGVPGVNFYDPPNKWCVSIYYKNKNYSVGYFADFDEAVASRKEAEAAKASNNDAFFEDLPRRKKEKAKEKRHSKPHSPKPR